MRIVWIGLVLLVCAWGGTAGAETVAERLLASYDAVESLRCEIRRDMPLPDGEVMRMLSRVYYQRPDKLHADNFSPIRRRTLSDGWVFRQYAEGAPKGFSRPVSELSEEMLINLRMVPGSAANLLEVLRGVAEVPLEPTEEYPVRAGYDNGVSFAVISLDAEGRMARFELYSSGAMTDLQTRADFSGFQEVLPGVWIAGLQRSRTRVGGAERTETTRVSGMEANGEIPAGIFLPDAFFEGVEFVDSYDKMAP